MRHLKPECLMNGIRSVKQTLVYIELLTIDFIHSQHKQFDENVDENRGSQWLLTGFKCCITLIDHFFEIIQSFH